MTNTDCRYGAVLLVAKEDAIANLGLAKGHQPSSLPGGCRGLRTYARAEIESFPKAKSSRFAKRDEEAELHRIDGSRTRRDRHCILDRGMLSRLYQVSSRTVRLDASPHI